jgi:hypothetical protein
MTTTDSQRSVAIFWHWFEENEQALFTFEMDQDRTFARLGAAMEAVHRNLTFEFGPVALGRREFVISADGIKDAFPFVHALADAAPLLPRWIIVRFRPRREPGEIRIGPTTIRSADVSIVPEALDGKVGLQVLIAGYQPTPNSLFEQIGFLLLDQVLGEFDVETKLGYIEIGARPRTIPANAISLEELPALVDRLAVT